MLKSEVGRPASGLQLTPRSSLRKRPCDVPASTGGSVPPEGAEATARDATTASPGKLPLTTAQLPPSPSDFSRKPETAVPLSAPANSVGPAAFHSPATPAMGNASRPRACQEPAPSRA